MTDMQRLQCKVVKATNEKHAGRIQKALAILDECEAIIKRIKKTPVTIDEVRKAARMVTTEHPNMADTFGQLKGKE